MDSIIELLKRHGSRFAHGQNQLRVLLIWVAVILLVILGFRYLSRTYDDYSQSIQNEIQVKTTRYNSLNRLMANAERFQEEHFTLARFHSEVIDSGLIHASTPALAEAQLQNLINSLADNSKLNVLSMRMLPRTQQGNITNIKIGINCRGEIGAIKNFLLQVENHEKFIFVDQIEIRIISQREKRHFNFNAQLVAWTK